MIIFQARDFLKPHCPGVTFWIQLSDQSHSVNESHVVEICTESKHCLEDS